MDPRAAPPSILLPPVATGTATATTTATVEEPLNHLAHLANPAPTTTRSFNNPSYSEMIYAAISALNERDGSSKRAIAKYIEKAYTGLPPTHSALLTHHLKRLKNNGLLVLVKKSYKLPRSDLTTINDTSTVQHLPQISVPGSSPSGPKRGRGRPPKPKPNSLPDANGQPIAQPLVQPQDGSHNQSTVEPALPLLFAVGLADEPNGPKRVINQDGLGVAKRGRGRPPKSGSVGTKKVARRPKRPKVLGSVLGPNGIKRRPGRPSKTLVVPYATSAPVENVPRPRGRPKKLAAAAGVTGAVLVPAKRPGRPPKVGGITKAKKSGGRPVGRPRKDATSSLGVAHQEVEAHGDLKRKLEFFQSRVTQAVGVLKPQLTSESAVAAIQELEGLALMDVNTPLRQEPEPVLPQN